MIFEVCLTTLSTHEMLFFAMWVMFEEIYGIQSNNNNKKGTACLDFHWFMTFETKWCHKVSQSEVYGEDDCAAH